MTSEKARHYFDFVAKMGMTKHYGSMAATRELVSLCHIGSGDYVLDVGCGVGATPSYLAKTVGCRVVETFQRPVNLSEKPTKSP